jgi:hypothetical protein
VYKRVPLVVRYTACGGLFNQHYSHVAALALALALGADVVLPAAVKRDSFAHYFSQDPSKNQVSGAHPHACKHAGSVNAPALVVYMSQDVFREKAAHLGCIHAAAIQACSHAPPRRRCTRDLRSLLAPRDLRSLRRFRGQRCRLTHCGTARRCTPG